MTNEKLDEKIEKSWIDKPKTHKAVNYGLLGSFAVHLGTQFITGKHPLKQGSGKAMMVLSAVHIYQKRKAIVSYFKGLKSKYDNNKAENNYEKKI